MTAEQWVMYARGAMHSAIRARKAGDHRSARIRAGDAWFYLTHARWAKELAEPAIEREAA